MMSAQRGAGKLLLALLSRPEVAVGEPQLVADLRGMLERRRRLR